MSHNYDDKVITIGKKVQKPKTTITEPIAESPTYVTKDVASLLAKTRNKKQMNLKEVGTKANISAAVLSQWESGKAVWCDAIAKKICKVYDLKYEDLVKMQKK